MASAMVGGLLSTGFPSSQIYISEPWDQGRARLAQQFPNVQVTTSNSDAVEFAGHASHLPASIVIFAVKPQVLKSVANEISCLVLQHSPLIISIAAGIRAQDLSLWLLQSNPSAASPAIVRVMPNTPALVNQGASGLFPNASVSEIQKQIAFDILKSISKQAYWVNSESMIDVVTGISGSGPAYFFLVVECLTAAGVDAGMPYEIAKGLASQTCLGAGKMLVDTAEDPAELRRKVTSPNGTTEAAIVSMEKNGIRELLKKGVKAAIDRSEELGEILSKVCLPKIDFEVIRPRLPVFD